jgi:hypothetical protein
MPACPCSADHHVTEQVERSLRTAIAHGYEVRLDPETNEHLWIKKGGNDDSPDAPGSSRAAAAQVEAQTHQGPSQEVEAPGNFTGLMRPPPASAAHVVDGRIVQLQ